MQNRILYFRTVPGKPLHRALTVERPCTMPDGTTHRIPVGFEWDGSSIFWLVARVFPRWRHPMASVDHDYGCKNAKNQTERLWHDKKFRKTVRKTSWASTAFIGWVGVRIGAFFGIGNRF